MDNDTPSGPLSEMALAFCDAYVDLGAAWGDGVHAARAAGYSDISEASLRVSASRLLKDKRVKARIWELVQHRVSAGLAMSIEGLMAFARGERPGIGGGRCSEELQFKALKELRELQGVQVIKQSEHKVVVEDHRTLAEIRASRLAIEAQLAAKKGLPALPPPTETPIDVEFTPVSADVETDWDAEIARHG